MKRIPPGRDPFAVHGFTLIEVVVVLLIISIVIGMAAVMTRGVVAAQKRSLTATRMAGIDAALVQFVTQQRRLPCPADGSLDASAANAGIEGNRTPNAGCTAQQNGVVPWRVLGLTETDATDGWDRRLNYRAGTLLTVDGGMDMSWCDAAGTGAAISLPTNLCNNNPAACNSTAVAGCTAPFNFLSGKGLQVRNVAGTVLMDPAANPHTGAAYVVISAGESGGGGYLNSGQLGASTSTDGNEEMKNYATAPFVNNTVTYHVDDSINTNPGATHFDDLVSRPSVLAVAAKAGLGPRIH
jgi:prepilin-type N-terminal cleavage/methylation domain-containing protein